MTSLKIKTVVDFDLLNYQPAATEAGRIMNKFLEKASIERLGTIKVGDYYAYLMPDPADAPQEAQRPLTYKIYSGGQYILTQQCWLPEDMINRLAFMGVPSPIILRDWNLNVENFGGTISERFANAPLAPPQP